MIDCVTAKLKRRIFTRKGRQRRSPTDNGQSEENKGLRDWYSLQIHLFTQG
jgi:hypothetical protein